MIKTIKCCLILLLFQCFSSLYSSEKMVIRLDDPGSAAVEQLVTDGYDIASYRPGEYLDIVVDTTELSSIRSQGFDIEITQTEDKLRNNLQPINRTVPGYRTYNEMLTELEEIADNYPEIARLYNIGDSCGKIYTDAGNDHYEDFYFDIWALKLTADPDSLSDKPAVFYMGTHHAREPLSTEVPMDFLQLLIDGYGEDEKTTFLVDNTEIWFIPLVNPDGHRVVLDRIDVWWRKNIRDNNENGVFDTSNQHGRGPDGVDLNRNYDWEWRYDPRNHLATYTGPEPGSEPEVSTLKDLMAERHFVTGITYHTYGEMVLYPYGYARGCRAPDHEALKELSDAMAEATPRYQREGHYLSMQSLDLYPARGVTEDYAYGRHGVFCYTIELATEFIPPPDAVRQISEDNMEAAMILLERTHRSTLTGIIRDRSTGEPIEAEIYIEEIDESGSFRKPYTNRLPFGRYYRLLVPGEHEVFFRSDAHVNSGPHLVTIEPDKQTILDIELYPLEYAELTGQVVDFFDHRPIRGARVSILNSSINPGFTDQEGLFSFDEVPYYNYTVKIEAIGFGTIYKEIDLVKPVKDLYVEMYPAFFTDSFEDAENWRTSGSWGLSSLESYVGEFSLADSPEGNYAPNSESYAQLEMPIDLTKAYNASVTFRTKYSMFDEIDYCYLQVKPEIDWNNDEWKTVASITGESDWVQNDINLAAYSGENISLRFLFSSDDTIGDEGIYIDDFKIFISSPELSTDQEVTPQVTMQLHQNIPNPFNPETTIGFELPKRKKVSLQIFNAKGQLVKTLLAREKEAGNHQVKWDGTSISGQEATSGIFFYRLKAGEQTVIRKMLLLK